MYICITQNLVRRSMNKTERKSNKSLEKSLNLVSELIIRNFGFAFTQTILLDEPQSFIYTKDSQPVPPELKHEDSILCAIKHKKQTFKASDYPLKEYPSLIKFYIGTPLFSSAGKTLGFLLLLDTKERHFTTEDISHIENFAKVIVDTLEKHQESQRLQQVFTDFMHKAIHDLKNPLTTISLTSELLKRKAEDPKMVINFSEKMERANQKLFSNLEKLKSAFPVADNHFKLVINEVNLNNLLQDIKSTVYKINITIANQIEKNIYVDYNRLKEAISLLISNNYLIENIDIKVKSYSKEKQAVIEIHSNEEYYDLKSTSFTIAKTLIEMHGGKITAENGKLVIYLPSENL